tara:strand:+ start:3188 stop:3373 length:186 start_codon:yes stop_codon:yes gene_type:complete
MTKEEIDFIINALEFTCENGYSQDKEWQKKADIIANKLWKTEAEDERNKLADEIELEMYKQ